MKNIIKKNYVRFIFICLGAIIALSFFLLIIYYFLVFNQTPTYEAELEEDYSKISSGFVSYTEDNYYPTLPETAPIKGNPNASVVIYEFADFGCNYSAQMQPIISSLLKKFPEKIKVVFKDSPTDYSYPAHLAARCAQAQGKFWEYSDMLWKQKDFSDATIISLAQSLNLNLEDFNLCIQNKSADKFIEYDSKEADALSILGTPHLYINKIEIAGFSTEEELVKIIQNEINN